MTSGLKIKGKCFIGFNKEIVNMHSNNPKYVRKRNNKINENIKITQNDINCKPLKRSKIIEIFIDNICKMKKIDKIIIHDGNIKMEIIILQPMPMMLH